MLFVCLSHFVVACVAPWGNPALSPVLRRSAELAVTLSMIASPTFVSVSGIVIGYLSRLNPSQMPALRRKLVDRGLFLLLIGHVLQAVPAFYTSRDVAQALRFVFITDVIGVAIIVGPSLVMWTSAAARAVLGVSLLLLTWAVSYFWTPHGAMAAELVRYAFGKPVEPMFSGFPLVPWLGVYVLATILGEWLGKDAQAAESHRAEKQLLRLGAAGVVAGAAITIGRHALRDLAPALASSHDVLLGFLALRKFPPGPTYLVFFGGAGMILVSTAFALAHHRLWTYVTRPLSAIGRASLFVFVIQGYVYYLAVPAIGLRFPQIWPVYYAATILFFLGLATLWNRFDGNRYLTVGLWRTVPIVKAVHARVLTTLAAR